VKSQDALLVAFLPALFTFPLPSLFTFPLPFPFALPLALRSLVFALRPWRLLLTLRCRLWRLWLRRL
jgi:hypothetical protein